MSWEFKSPHPHLKCLPHLEEGFFIADSLLIARSVVRVWGRSAARLRLLSSFLLQPPLMLVLKITNAPEVVASKIGRFLEALTPDALDEKTIEDVLIKELIKNLSAEGLKGEVAAVHGIDLQNSSLVVGDGLHVRQHKTF